MPPTGEMLAHKLELELSRACTVRRATLQIQNLTFYWVEWRQAECSLFDGKYLKDMQTQ